MKYIFTLFILFSGSFAFSANESVPSDRKIRELVVYDDALIIRFSPEFTNTQGCTSTAKHTIQLDLADDPDKYIYSTVLAAAASGKTIGFGIGDCAGQYPRVYRANVNF